MNLAERTATILGIDHAGFDIAWIEGHPYLFEFNVLFPSGVRLSEEILRHLEAMMPRDKPTRPSEGRIRRAA